MTGTANETSRPVIGITGYVEDASFGVWNMRSALVPYAYVRQVAEAGGQPVLLPPVGAPASLVDRLDGLVVAGGGDIDPALYGAEPHPEVSGVRDFRDGSELALVHAALDRDLPFLGICRGLQVLNVALGGTLVQHLPDVVGGRTDHSPAPGVYGHFPVRVEPGSRTAEALGGDTTPTVAHYHHQSIDRLGTGLRAVAWADDGVVEAAELPGRAFALGVQWHPEVGDDPALFLSFVAAARIYAGGEAADTLTLRR
ncbi:gamma-glutamyl-gamma-aminobutyrate hydrolase family protein [Actinomadura miaoliensis]|uniref:Gamma-glutamyl-gamma-aminobutyrate hydrolase family protein n=1 Tax=Actinomadura miaoliensis TaxID=430685 RepID=A0ABP7W4J9_9ACTN